MMMMLLLGSSSIFLGPSSVYNFYRTHSITQKRHEKVKIWLGRFMVLFMKLFCGNSRQDEKRRIIFVQQATDENCCVWR